MLSVHRLAAFVTLVAGVLANPSPMGDCNGQSYDTNAVRLLPPPDNVECLANIQAVYLL